VKQRQKAEGEKSPFRTHSPSIMTVSASAAAVRGRMERHARIAKKTPVVRGRIDEFDKISIRKEKR